jgi:hypothetical protein
MNSLGALLWMVMAWQQAMMGKNCDYNMTVPGKTTCFTSDSVTISGPVEVRGDFATPSGEWSCVQYHDNITCFGPKGESPSGVCGPIAPWAVCIPEKQVKVQAAPPFDVPPVEIKTEITFYGNFGPGKTQLGTDPRYYVTSPNKNVNEAVEYRRTCADKSRFLLMDESGTWHCLALGQKQ